MSTEIILVLMLLVLVVGGYIIYRLYAQETYEFTEDYYENLNEYRTVMLSTIANFIQSKYWKGSPDDPDAPEIIPLQSGPDTSLISINLPGNKTISFEVNWTTYKIHLTAQKLLDDGEDGTEVIYHSAVVRFKNGAVVDFKDLLKFLNKFESKIYDIKDLTCEEILEVIASSEELQSLPIEQRKQMLFSVLFDMADLITKNKRCSRRQMNIMMSRLFTYVIGNYREALVDYINEKKE